MTSERPDIVEAGPPVRLGPRPAGDPVRTGWDRSTDHQPVVTSLDDLSDVDAPASAVGVLSRTVAGASAEFRAASYHHDQSVAVEQWLIAHDLPFTPSGVVVTGDAGQQLYPLRIAHPGVGRTRLEFTRPVAGTAELS